MLEQAERGKGFLSSFSFRCLRSLEDLLASSKGEEGERERRGRERVRDSGGSAPANLRSSVGLFWKKILDKINVANHLENERSHLVTTKKRSTRYIPASTRSADPPPRSQSVCIRSPRRVSPPTVMVDRFTESIARTTLIHSGRLPIHCTLLDPLSISNLSIQRSIFIYTTRV